MSRSYRVLPLQGCALFDADEWAPQGVKKSGTAEFDISSSLLSKCSAFWVEELFYTQKAERKMNERF